MLLLWEDGFFVWPRGFYGFYRGFNGFNGFYHSPFVVGPPAFVGPSCHPNMGAAASITDNPLPVENPDAGAPWSFPTTGVRLSAFHDFVQTCGGEANLHGLTTQEVCEKYIQSFTSPWQCSYCELLRRTGHPAVGTATVFISHTWSANFLHTVHALQDYFKSNLNVIVWLDIFSWNQHQTPFSGGLSIAPLSAYIGRVGHTVMVLTTWHDSVPFERAWCLYEMHATLQSRGYFDIAMSREQKAAFMEAVELQPTDVMDKLLRDIDLASSRCSLDGDHMRIVDAVSRSVGIDGFNNAISRGIRQHLLSVINREIQKRGSMCSDSGLRTVLVAVQDQLGRLDERLDEAGRDANLINANDTQYSTAAPLSEYQVAVSRTDSIDLSSPLVQLLVGDEESLIRILDRRKQDFGESHPDTLTVMQSLAQLYSTEGRWTDAVEMWHTCWQHRQQALGESHLLTMETAFHLALAYKHVGDQLVNAEKLLLCCLCSKRKAFGDFHDDTQQCRRALADVYLQSNNHLQTELMLKQWLRFTIEKGTDESTEDLEVMEMLVHALTAQGKTSIAVLVLQELLEVQCKLFGEQHPNSLATMCDIAKLYEELNEPFKAEGFYRRSLSGRRERLGMKSSKTLSTMEALASVLTVQSKYDEALLVLEELYSAVQKLAGIDSDDTIKVMGSLGHVHYLKGQYVQAEPFLRRVYQFEDDTETRRLADKLQVIADEKEDSVRGPTAVGK